MKELKLVQEAQGERELNEIAQSLRVRVEELVEKFGKESSYGRTSEVRVRDDRLEYSIKCRKGEIYTYISFGSADLNRTLAFRRSNLPTVLNKYISDSKDFVDARNLVRRANSEDLASFGELVDRFLVARQSSSESQSKEV